MSVELQRDSNGHVALDHEQAAAVARAIPLAPDWHNAAWDIWDAIAEAGDVPVRALARYVLRVAAERAAEAAIVAAAVRQEAAQAAADRAYQPYQAAAYQTAKAAHNHACTATEAAVRAAALAPGGAT